MTARTEAPASRNAWLARMLAVVASFLLIGVLVVTGSRAAFSDTTDNPANSFAAGDVDLVDDDSDNVLFSVTNMAPGDSASHCILVTYQGSLTPAEVKLYGSTAGTGLDSFLDLTVEIGSGGSFADCTGFVAGSTLYTGTLAGFAGSHSDWSNGLAAWSPASNPSARTFRFTVALQDDDGAEGLDATANFTWEAQNS